MTGSPSPEPSSLSPFHRLLQVEELVSQVAPVAPAPNQDAITMPPRSPDKKTRRGTQPLLGGQNPEFPDTDDPLLYKALPHQALDTEGQSGLSSFLLSHWQGEQDKDLEEETRFEDVLRDDSGREMLQDEDLRGECPNPVFVCQPTNRACVPPCLMRVTTGVGS